MEIYRCSWGLVGAGADWAKLSEFIPDAAAEGYSGVEFPLAHLAFEDGEPGDSVSRVREELEEAGLSVIPLIATRPSDWGSAKAHLEVFRQQARRASDLNARKVSVHCGADSFDHATAVGFLRDCLSAASDLGLEACIETHRGRPLFEPWRTARLLEALPEMKLTSDLSHWHVVVDREPNDIMDLFDEASRRSGHVHARVGHEKGAQVPHPGDPAWVTHLKLYRRWWSISRDSALARGAEFTVTPEFGPPPYMNTRPFTHEPDADVVELNGWMRDRLIEWF